MANAPSPWKLRCHWCDFFIVVNARGMRGGDMGSGFEAAELMREHVERDHGQTWFAFVARL